MSYKQQTSVDWIAHKLSSLNWDYLVGGIDNKTFNIRYDEILTKAKQMEKEQIIDFTDNYVDNCVIPNENMAIPTIKDVPQYYKETYEQ